MLALLNNKSIAQYWEFMETTALESLKLLPDIKPDFVNKLLEAAMLGRFHCWLIHNADDIVGGIITQHASDMITGQKSLLVYAMHFWGEYPLRERKQDFDKMAVWARNCGAESISFFTANEALEQHAKLVNGRQTFTQRYTSLQL